MRTDVKAACMDLAAKLRDPDLGGGAMDADVDPELLSPPCVWIQPREIRDATLDGGGTLVAWCYVIATNTETGNAMALLDDGLEGLLDVADVAESDRVIDLMAAVILPGNPTTPLPAYRVAVDLDL